jgi:hypothetical protein
MRLPLDKTNGREAYMTEQRIIIDFLYHFQSEVAKIVHVTDNSVTYSESSFDIHNTLRSALLKSAKQILKDELEYSIGAIRPVYNIDTMIGTGGIADFISGLNCSLFYMRSDLTI